MKSVLAIMLLIGGSAFAQTHTGAMLDLPNAFTNTDSFSLGITVGPITFSQLAGISNSTTIIYISDGSQTNPCTGSGSGALAIRINGAWSCASGAGTGTVTSIATTGPITGGTITATGTIACATCVTASSPGAGVAHFAGGTQAVTSSLVNLTSATDVTGTLPQANLTPVTLPTPGTSVSLAAPSEIYVCTSTCTVTPPVPAAGYQFCVMNDDNVATVITLAAIGSSARYENTARTAYGTAGTGTFVSGGAVKDMVCIVGRDSTHYLTTNFNGTWTAN